MLDIKHFFGVNDSPKAILIFVPKGDASHPGIFATQHLSAAHAGEA
tara:strand:- start:216 stop:353 length:138 start_codon:yes stop_codon:yes gene_type:complete